MVLEEEPTEELTELSVTDYVLRDAIYKHLTVMSLG